MIARARRDDALAPRVEAAQLLERQRATRTLLAQPLVRAWGRHSEEFGLIRRHAAHLRDWFAHEAGWRLQVEPDFARLRKTPADSADATRPGRDPNGLPFTRARYVLFCLTLAALERSDRQTVLGALASQVETFYSSEPRFAALGLDFSLEQLRSRRDLAAVVKFLIDQGALVRVHGDEERFVSGTGDVLYNVERALLSTFLNVARGPSTLAAGVDSDRADSDDDDNDNSAALEADADAPQPQAQPRLSFDERLERIRDESGPLSEEARSHALRHRVVRRLLEDPVVYFDELSPEERDYLQSQRSRLTAKIEAATGLLAEVRAEGIAFVDERGDLTDLRLPEQGTDGHLTLLLAEYLSARLRAARGAPCRVGLAELEAHTASLIEEHRRHWRRDVTEPGAESRLAADAVERLAALGLVRRRDGAIEPRPAIGRYALDTAEDPADAGLAQGGLFE